MPIGRFERWVRGFRLAFNGPNFRAFAGAIAAAVGDRGLAELRQAVRESYPSLANSERSLGLFGSFHGIDRGPAESVASYRERLANYVAQKKLQGKPLGLLVQLHYLGFPGAMIVQQNGLAHQLVTADVNTPDLTEAIATKTPPSWYVITTLAGAKEVGDHPWWFFDADTDLCHRFGILFPSGTPDPDLGTSVNLDRLRRTVRRWKAGKSKCAGAWVVSAGDVWDWPVDEWDNPADNWDDPAPVVTYYSAE